MGGGYSPDLRTIVEAHCDTFRIARDLYGLRVNGRGRILCACPFQ